ncbi:hypothetical protein NE857_31515 [Nocardiopsis exhalans]|uniref:Uncharacterized protein n=1 Tax=Nocardiopsis exhalans TaxID=163604 RepID=A0ABY5D9H6_9ACTN|nr:hypothetical protein [Nocardiopsis exhalans]USY19708.1 hypothetical protein NE857_31515 [Nocardiopsis exhalans]
MAAPDERFHELRQAQKRAHHSRIAWSDANDANNARLAAAAARVYEADVNEVLQIRQSFMNDRREGPEQHARWIMPDPKDTQDAINQALENIEAARERGAVRNAT